MAFTQLRDDERFKEPGLYESKEEGFDYIFKHKKEMNQLYEIQPYQIKKHREAILHIKPSTISSALEDTDSSDNDSSVMSLSDSVDKVTDTAEKSRVVNVINTFIESLPTFHPLHYPFSVDKYPHYQMSWWVESDDIYKVRVDQIQTTGYFDMPIDISFRGGQGQVMRDTTLRINNSSSE